MSTAILERVEEVTQVDDDKDLDHIVCHCDMSRGWCGVELGFTIEAKDGVNPCPDCDAKILELVDKCPWGCDCTPEMRMLYCGLDPEEDEDE